MSPATEPIYHHGWPVLDGQRHQWSVVYFLLWREKFLCVKIGSEAYLLQDDDQFRGESSQSRLAVNHWTQYVLED
jgi:hypothetical protein